MSRCPQCFHVLPFDRFSWTCTSGQCKKRPDPAASAFQGSAVESGPVYDLLRPPGAPSGWVAPSSAVCPGCKEFAQEVCPDCHTTLLPGWRTAQTTCVAMAGARATGKSLYIAVLVKQLEQLAERLGTTFEPATSQTRDTYGDVYERPLYEQRGIMAPTPRVDTADSYQREPLIFRLGARDGVARFLVLRDVAGEDLETQSGTARHLNFFAHADGVFFMFDPLRVQEIQDQLQELVPSQLNLGGDPKVVLGNVMRIIGQATPRVAMILSKFDAVQALRAVSGTEWSRIMSNPGAAFLREGGGDRGPYDEVDGELLHHEVRSLLQKLHAGPIVTAVERPSSGQFLPHRFFVASALGESPNGKSLNARGIAPFRCLDPMRWVMAEMGML